MNGNNIIDMLTAYNLDSDNDAVYAYFNKDNIWKILDVQRYEPSHSAFLVWFFSQKNPQYSQIRNLLNLIVAQASPDILKNDWNSTYDMASFASAIITGAYSVKTVSVTPEMLVNKISTIRYPDKMDIYIRCIITMFHNGTEQDKCIEIIIENKVDSPEGQEKLNDLTNPSDNEKTYKNLFQTERYYLACSKESGNRQKEDTDYQLFVFLTSDRKKSRSVNYVLLTYQDLVDYVFENYLKRQDINKDVQTLLNDYIYNLGNPFNKKNKSIMAMNTEEKELLVSFFNRNKELFEITIDAMTKQAEEDGDAEAATEYSAIKQSFRSAGHSQSYSVTLPNQSIQTVNGHTALALLIVSELARTMDSYALIDKLNNLKFNGSCIKDIILKSAEIHGTRKMYTGSAIKCNDGVEIFCSNQWIPAKVTALIKAISDTDIKVKFLS